MEREIKFRAKDSHNIWRYGCIVKFDGLHPAIYFPIRRKDNSSVIATDWVTAKEETVGQFTGLYDKNGKEIYEGDIICSPRGNKHYIVYDENNGSYAAVKVGNEPEDGMCSITKYWIEHYEKEVIGNIYDNPELLKET